DSGGTQDALVIASMRLSLQAVPQKISQEMPKMAKTHRNCGHSTRGFSIMELLIVVAIILIIAAVAIPNFQSVMAQIRLRSSASAVAGVIQQARIRSVRDNRIYSIAFDTTVTPTR